MDQDFHRKNRGKIKVEGKVPLESQEDMSAAYTPGVANPVEEIVEDPSKVYNHTAKGEMAAVVSNGSAVLGLGDVGPEAAIPVIEGKALIIRELGGVSAFPVVLDEDDPDELIGITERLHPMFGFIMLEDIASPACFDIERALKERMHVPVFHDDQHGAAIATLAGLKNALEIVDKEIAGAEIVIIGAGAAGIATAHLLRAAGADHIRMVDTQGILHGETTGLNTFQEEIAAATNPDHEEGDLADALDGADVMIGLSAGGVVSQDMVRSMAEDPIVFALANPDPEIEFDAAADAGAAVIGTGRSDRPNQINNVVAFPGVVKGCLNCYVSDITTEMQLAAADALAEYVDQPIPERIIPSALNREVHTAVARAVTAVAHEDGLCRVEPDYSD